MHQIQQQAYDQAIQQAQRAMAQQQWHPAMEQLKRAHVLGQLAVQPHVYTHWLMLLVEWRRRRFGAVVGQFIRMVLGVIGSAVGKVPTGNTGDSEISMFLSLPIAPELQQIIDGKAADSTKLSASTGLTDDQFTTSNNNNKDSSA
ncbi:hypothetical protein A5320_05815 [Rheinheimera sp. SA_1]|uniref:DUF3703 domain-containing protein n=1 Tax=Rheinheimera sp. SA_1 TaxID=1827365 RepID=UPI00080163E3|nr:DUF3703 domain-containing protein [Rheinheimera sp. SA_1]OBP16876.1 hypothetical protein A5320_05815 [Rheinheimera sp. SA_1]